MGSGVQGFGFWSFARVLGFRVLSFGVLGLFWDSTLYQALNLENLQSPNPPGLAPHLLSFR